MSVFDRLLETDAEKLKEKDQTELEITRLSVMLGEPFKVTCMTLTEEQVNHVLEISKERDFKQNFILEACRIEGRRLNDKELLAKFGVPSAKEVVGKLFRPGEIAAIYNTINKLCGYSEDTVVEVKN